MPNDAPFSGDSATQQPSQQATPASEGSPPAQPAHDPQSAARVLQQAISGALQPIAQRMEQLEQRFQQSAPQQPAHPAPSTSDDDWIDKVANPDKFKDLVTGIVRETIGPVLVPIAESTRKAGELEARSRVVEEYGEEFWEEKVQPRYRTIMDQIRSTNPVATISPEHIETVISSVLGGRELSKDAAQARAKAEQARTAAARTAAPRFIGPGRPQLSEHEGVSDEDRSIIARIQRSLGKDAITEKDVLEGRKARTLQEAG